MNIVVHGIFEPNRSAKEPLAVPQKGIFKFVDIPVVEVFLNKTKGAEINQGWQQNA